MRKLSALLFLVALGAIVWYGARWFTHKDDVKATIVFGDAGALQRGDAVVEKGAVIGRITAIDRLDGRPAVTIRIPKESRERVLSDSLFTVDGRTLVVTNTFAFGSPVDDGAIVQAREDRVSRFLAKAAPKVQPFVDDVKAKADQLFETQLDEWKAKVPDWKREGKESLDRNLAAAKARVEKMQEELRKKNKEEEARKLKERFDRWVEEVRK